MEVELFYRYKNGEVEGFKEEAADYEEGKNKIVQKIKEKLHSFEENVGTFNYPYEDEKLNNDLSLLSEKEKKQVQKDWNGEHLTFKELLYHEEIDFNQVMEAMESQYEGSKEETKNYKKTFFTLLNAEVDTNKYEPTYIHVNLVRIPPVKPEEVAKFFERFFGNSEQDMVALFKENESDTKEIISYDVVGYQIGMGYSLALEFRPWKEWAGYRVDKSQIKRIGLNLFVAMALYEMTFVSFDEKEINSEMEETINLKNEITQLLEEFHKQE